MYIYPCWRCSLYSVQEHCALPALFDSARKVLQQHTHSNGFQASLLSWWTKCLRTGMWTWKWLTGVRAKFLCVCLNDSGPGFGVWSYYSETKVFIHIQYDFFLKDHSIFPVGCLVNWTTECQFAGENCYDLTCKPFGQVSYHGGSSKSFRDKESRMLGWTKGSTKHQWYGRNDVYDCYLS